MEESLILMTIDRSILKDDFTRGGGAAAAAAGNGGKKQPPLKAFRSLRALSFSKRSSLTSSLPSKLDFGIKTLFNVSPIDQIFSFSPRAF